MTKEHDNPDFYQAYGEGIAADPKLGALKEEARLRLERGQSEDAVVRWLTGATRRFTTRAERVTGGHRWLTLWILDWAKTGKPGPIFREARGSVGTGRWRIRKGKRLPIVWAVAGPMSDPEAIAAEFLRQCRAVLPDETWANKQEPERDARWFRLHEEGKTDWEISTSELPPEHHSWGMPGTIRQARNRWKRYVTRITGSR